MKNNIFIMVALLSSALMAPADLLFEESFDYIGAALTGQNGGTGFSSSWDAGSLASGNMSYTDGNGVSLATSGQMFSGSGAVTAFRSVTSGLDASSSGVYWLTYLLRGNAAAISYGGLSLFDASNEIVYTGLNTASQHRILCYKPGSFGVNIDTATNSLSAFLAFKLTMASGSATDKIELFVNPDLGVEPTGTADIEISSRDIYFDRIRIGSNQSIDVDEIRFGETWSDVAPTTQAIPEPSSLVLLLSAGAMLVRHLRSSK